MLITFLSTCYLLYNYLNQYILKNYPNDKSLKFSFILSNILQLLQRYPNGISYIICQSELYLAYNVYRNKYNNNSNTLILQIIENFKINHYYVLSTIDINSIKYTIILNDYHYKNINMFTIGRTIKLSNYFTIDRSMKLINDICPGKLIGSSKYTILEIVENDVFFNPFLKDGISKAYSSLSLIFEAFSYIEEEIVLNSNFDPTYSDVENFIANVTHIGRLFKSNGLHKHLRRLILEDIACGFNNRVCLILYDDDAKYYDQLIKKGRYAFENLLMVRNANSIKMEIHFELSPISFIYQLNNIADEDSYYNAFSELCNINLLNGTLTLDFTFISPPFNTNLISESFILKVPSNSPYYLNFLRSRIGSYYFLQNLYRCKERDKSCVSIFEFDFNSKIFSTEGDGRFYYNLNELPSLLLSPFLYNYQLLNSIEKSFIGVVTIISVLSSIPRKYHMSCKNEFINSNCSFCNCGLTNLNYITMDDVTLHVDDGSNGVICKIRPHLWINLKLVENSENLNGHEIIVLLNRVNDDLIIELATSPPPIQRAKKLIKELVNI